MIMSETFFRFKDNNNRMVHDQPMTREIVVVVVVVLLEKIEENICKKVLKIIVFGKIHILGRSIFVCS